MSVGPRFQGTGRGVFGLGSWDPLPKPGESAVPVAAKSAVVNTAVNESVPMSVNGRSSQPANNDSGSVGSQTKTDGKKPPNAPTNGQRLVAKFNYNANPDSPLGKNAELSLRTMEKMTMMGPHKQQEYWWFVKMDNGQEGYIPANYVTVFEEKVTSLPWLANKVVEPVLEPTNKDQPYKPYKSAYAPKEDKDDASAAPKWYCDVCEKAFNGPQPHNAHMTSRAHKDEVEARAAYPR